ncbi:MAG TPA: MFS transporter [Candidatus Paceibacterota bacterium]|nr:MFS transporter [Verrucomicrobiota bacterium]HSA09356.1 MFS transporter [Candidatus Paceibacterota bacterium]
MFPRRLKAGCFVLEGLNSFATVYYFYYFYFFMQTEFGYGNRANLLLAALNGGVYALMAWLGGMFAQRFGYFTALKLGFGIMIAALAVGSQLHSAAGHIMIMALAVVGMCFTWPTLEALVSEGESRAGVQRMVGIYNVMWSGTAAVSYFIGGAVFEVLGPRSLFYLPAAIVLVQFCLTFWLEAKAGLAPHSPAERSAPATPPLVSATRTKVFLQLAWLANPFAYIAINTLIAVMPGVAGRLDLSTTAAGFCCSLWCFSRVASFFVLWHWAGWHYRFRWLAASYVTMIVTFAVIVMAPNLAVVILAQLIFGVVAGLIYYSSLFYSMDLGDTKGEHGGIHEAAIGLGNFAGPAVGAASLYFLPQYTHSGALAVSGLLLLGLGGLLAVWRRGT